MHILHEELIDGREGCQGAKVDVLGGVQSHFACARQRSVVAIQELYEGSLRSDGRMIASGH